MVNQDTFLGVFTTIFSPLRHFVITGFSLSVTVTVKVATASISGIINCSPCYCRDTHVEDNTLQRSA